MTTTLHADAKLSARKDDVPGKYITFDDHSHSLALCRRATESQVAIELAGHPRHLIARDVRVELRGATLLLHLDPSIADKFGGEAQWEIHISPGTRSLDDIRTGLEEIFDGTAGFISTLHSAPAEALALGQNNFAWRQPCGFIAGTPVLTKRGPVAINALQIGDLVLSTNEHTGQPAFQPVVRTFHFPEKAVFRLQIADRAGVDMLVCSAAQLLWNQPQEQGETRLPPLWRSADSIDPGGAVLKTADRRDILANDVALVWRTAQDNVGWVNLDSYQYRSDDGYQVHFQAHGAEEQAAQGVNDFPAWRDDWNGNPDACNGTLKRAVYNIEVAGDHTYFVGRHGVWVHDMSEH